MTIAQLLSILKARWISAIVVALLTIGATVAASLLMPKSYTATASVVLDIRSPDPIVGMPMNGMASPSYMATQVDILTSERVAQRVVQKLRLTENQEMRKRWTEDTGGKGNFEAWIADIFQKKLDVKPSRESNVIHVSYTNPDPRFASALANTFVQAYIETSIGLRASPAKQYNEFFDARGKELREAVEVAQEKLTTFQKANGLTGADERFDIETQRLNELNTQLVTLQAIAADSSSRSAQVRTSGDQMQEVLTNSLVSSLRADLTRQEAKLTEMNAKFGDAHPQVQELRANIGELRQRLEAETRRVTGGVGVTGSINRQREAETRAALDAQRSKVLRLKALRDEAVTMQRAVETAQRAYDQVTQRFNQTSLESQLNQSNISVLSPANEPTDHSSPKIILNILVSVFVGTLLGVSFAILRELTDRRVRTLDDLTSGLDVAVLGTIPKPLRAGLSGRHSPMVLPTNILRRLPKPGT
ncbi:chain length determinant protein EpsF [Sphaerotilus montanus]|uniref:chain length determinant protein EpsF n=1 Tax=Sphaerotilus montanus TaxID=522889 RepID=UPI003FA1ACF2